MLDRELFEKYIRGDNPMCRSIERDGDGYRLIQTHQAWKLWCEIARIANGKLVQAEYIIGAFERGADANEYAIDIADFRRT